MGRSLKKGPHVDERLFARVEKQGMNKEPLKTWQRDCTIVPEFIGATFLVHNGKAFVKVYVTEEMGNETLVRLSVDGSHITARAAAGTRLDFDMPVWFRFRGDKLHWFDKASGPGSLHVDAAAQAALLAVARGAPGIYNVAEDDGAVSIDKARRELGFDASFRLSSR